jgi:glycosyltransferase 2 family protein
MSRLSPDSQSFRRVRRPTDLLLSLAGVIALLVVIELIHALPLGSAELSGDVSRWLHHVPRWLSFATVVVASVGALAFLAVALVALLRRERRGAVNATIAAVSAAAGTIATSIAWHVEQASVAHAVLLGHNAAPFVVDAAFVAFVVGSDLVRRPRWSRWCVLSCAALLLTGPLVDALTPFALLLSLLAGLSIGWLVRWLLGATSVQPGFDQLGSWLLERRIAVQNLAPSGPKDFSMLEGVLPDGRAVEIRMTNRDTRGSGLLRRLWALVRFRTTVAGHVALSSRAKLEQLALASYLAQSAKVVAPEVLLLDETTAETLVLVLAMPTGSAVEGPPISVEDARSLFVALRALHDRGVAHRDLRSEHLLVGRGVAGFSSLDAALPGAGDLIRRLDLAQLLATLGRMVGSVAAVQAFRAGYGAVDEASLAAILQPIALAPWGWSAVREATGCLVEVRHELLGADTTAPTARLERFRWRTVLTTVALTVAAYLFIGQLSKVDLLGALRHTNLGWFGVALVGSAITYLAAAENLAAFVPKHLSPVRGFFVQLSTAFVGIAMPPTVGHVAVNARYLARQKIDGGAITAAVALSQIVNVVTTVPLLIVFGLLTGSGLSHFKIVPGADVLIGLAVVAGVGGLLLAVPQTRARLHRVVGPRLQSLWPHLLDALSQPLRLVAGVGANLLLTFGYLVAFIAALLAVGAHPALLPAAVVYLAGNTVGSLAPTPGGLGAIEAVLAAGLTAMGIPAHEAIPAVLVFRLATFWLPIPVGWLSYLALQRSGTL